MDGVNRGLPGGGVLVPGNRILAVGPSIVAPEAQVIDAAWHFVTPGLIDGRHDRTIAVSKHADVS